MDHLTSNSCCAKTNSDRKKTHSKLNGRSLTNPENGFCEICVNALISIFLGSPEINDSFPIYLKE
jgi:hypothetical protein